jgi:hypothetical protein
MQTSRYVFDSTCGKIFLRQTISPFGPKNAYLSVWDRHYGHFVCTNRGRE